MTENLPLSHAPVVTSTMLSCREVSVLLVVSVYVHTVPAEVAETIVFVLSVCTEVLDGVFLSLAQWIEPAAAEAAETNLTLTVVTTHLFLLLK